MAARRDADPLVRRAQRVLFMVHELHKRGYQRVRIAPGIAPSGMFWRCSITHAGNIQQAHGAMLCEDGGDDRDIARYTTGQDDKYFKWEDASQDTARQLAVKFIDRFPDIVRQGKGTDWLYAGWYVQMLGFAERGILPVAYDDWADEPDPRWLPTTAGFNSGLPRPPGGERSQEGAPGRCI